MRTRVARLIQAYPSPRPSFGQHPSRIETTRLIHIEATPTSLNAVTLSPISNAKDIGAPTDSSSPDARFEVLGSSASLLSVSLSASQDLCTRRGTLIGLSGSPENAISKLSLIKPFIRAPLGIPWLYQRIQSTTPAGLMIGAKSPSTTLTVINLDGRTDWMVAQRNGLLAWTGRNLILKPTADFAFQLAHWGKTTLTGRGLVALVGSGNIFQINLNAGETYVAHPQNVLAYSMNHNPPQPYRFKPSTISLQTPDFASVIPDTTFVRNMRKTSTYKTIGRFLFMLRTWTRRTIWGERLFMRFHGPTTILLQARGSRIRDVLTNSNVNEIADVQAGAVQDAVESSTRRRATAISGDDPRSDTPASKLTHAHVGNDGKVTFEPRSS